MKALIAFIVMALLILTLIEINERMKAKKKKEDHPRDDSCENACSDCGLVDVCEKDKKKNISK